jgi:hypothetical protein
MKLTAPRQNAHSPSNRTTALRSVHERIVRFAASFGVKSARRSEWKAPVVRVKTPVVRSEEPVVRSEAPVVRSEERSSFGVKGARRSE